MEAFLSRAFWFLITHLVAFIGGIVVTLLYKQQAINKLKDANAALLERLK